MKTKLAYRTRFDIGESRPTPSGERFRINYIDSLTKEGVKVVKETAPTDMQEQINSYFSDVDLYTILSRVLPNVDSRDISSITVSELLKTYFTDFTASEGFYADITDMPKNIHEVNKTYVEMCDFFNNLPSDIRLKYHNSVDEFVAGFDGFIGDVNQMKSDIAKSLVVDEPKKEGEK